MTESLSGQPISTPIRRTRSPCCARAATGHAAAPPSSDMNSRRLIHYPSTVLGKLLVDVRRGPVHNDRGLHGLAVTRS